MKTHKPDEEIVSLATDISPELEQAKFTPGYWHVGMKPGPIIYGPNGEQVADLRGDLLEREEQMANARLIAAAPTLLDALLHASLRLDMTDNYGTDGLRHKIEDAIVMAQGQLRNIQS